MPELPDITAYIAALEPRILGATLERIRLNSVFVLRTADPPIASVEGRAVRELRRIGKRIAIGLEGDPVTGPESQLWLVIHLMIAGRLHWRPPHAKLSGRQSLLALDFPSGSLTLTEAGSKRRASLHFLRGEQALRDIDPGGIEIFSTDLEGFRAALTLENRTLKRALTDPRLFSGIGNAYSDEILHAARLSPIALTHKLTTEEWERLFAATRSTLELWIARLSSEARKKFPENVTAFRPEMAVHGRFGQPCPRCGAHPAHPLRRQRDQLLPRLPDRRKTSRRPQPLAPARLRLASHPRGTGSPQAPLIGLARPLFSGLQIVTTSALYPLNCLDIAVLLCSRVFAATPVRSASGEPHSVGLLCVGAEHQSRCGGFTNARYQLLRDPVLGDALKHQSSWSWFRPSVSGCWDVSGTVSSSVRSWRKLVGLPEGEKPKNAVFGMVVAFIACLLLSYVMVHVLSWTGANTSPEAQSSPSSAGSALWRRRSLRSTFTRTGAPISLPSMPLIGYWPWRSAAASWRLSTARPFRPRRVRR